MVAARLRGALTEVGVPKEKDPYYAESVRRGDAIVTVRTDPPGADRALRIMNAHGAVDLEARIASWRQRGWSGYNPGAEPLSEDELRRERAYYAAAGDQHLTEKERKHAGDEPGTVWPHEEADRGWHLSAVVSRP